MIRLTIGSRGDLVCQQAVELVTDLYRFKTRCIVSDQVFHEIGYAAR